MADWTVEGRCPHGLKVSIPFEDLGYLMKPKDEQCEQHLNREAEREERRLDAAVRRPGWYTLWKEQRAARRALRHARPEDFDGS